MLPRRFIVITWVAITLAATLISVVAEIRDNQHAREVDPLIWSNLRVLVQLGADALADGDAARRRFLRDVAENILDQPFRLVILDARDGIVAAVGTGPAAEPALAHLGQRARRSGRLEAESAGDLLALALAANAPDGERYVVTARSPTAARFTDTPADELVARYIAIVALTSITCIVLARHSRSPLVSVSRVSRKLARGELGVRVPAEFTRRTDELGLMVRNFNTMADRVEAVVDTQSRMLRDVSHELRSPLSRLQIAVELARTAGTPGEPLKRVSLEAERMAKLIDDLLAYTRVQSGQGETLEARVPVAKLVRDVAADARYEAGVNGITLRMLRMDECTVTGNENLLRSAVDNILRNAVKYTAEGTSVDVSVRLRSERVVMTVRDHGPGVQTSELERIFDPFYRVDVARQRETGGTGLGLSIARRIVQTHGGSIRAFNERRGGLSIVVVLPLAPSPKRRTSVQ